MGQPKVCMGCGINFMKKTPWDESEKKCNSCLSKEKKKSKGVKEVTIKISIECSESDHLKIESICFESGKTFSDYFLELHHKSLSNDKSNGELETSVIKERKKRKAIE